MRLRQILEGGLSGGLERRSSLFGWEYFFSQLEKSEMGDRNDPLAGGQNRKLSADSLGGLIQSAELAVVDMIGMDGLSKITFPHPDRKDRWTLFVSDSLIAGLGQISFLKLRRIPLFHKSLPLFGRERAGPHRDLPLDRGKLDERALAMRAQPEIFSEGIPRRDRYRLRVLLLKIAGFRPQVVGDESG